MYVCPSFYIESISLSRGERSDHRTRLRKCWIIEKHGGSEEEHGECKTTSRKILNNRAASGTAWYCVRCRRISCRDVLKLKGRLAFQLSVWFTATDQVQKNDRTATRTGKVQDKLDMGMVGIQLAEMYIQAKFLPSGVVPTDILLPLY